MFIQSWRNLFLESRYSKRNLKVKATIEANKREQHEDKEKKRDNSSIYSCYIPFDMLRNKLTGRDMQPY